MRHILMLMPLALVACASQTPNVYTPRPPLFTIAENADMGGEPTSSKLLDKSEVSRNIATKITSNWLIHSKMAVRNQGPLRVTIKLKEDGSLEKGIMTRSSGNLAFDQSLFRAINKSFPLPIPPTELPKYREFEMEFSKPMITQVFGEPPSPTMPRPLQ